MPAIRTLLVDDSPQFTNAAKRFLSSNPQIEVIGTALSGQDALEQVHLLKPHLVLMDITLPGMSGLETTRHIKTQPDAPRVVILTMYDNPEYRAASEAAKADGFIQKSDFGALLLPLIQTLFEGDDFTEQVLSKS